MHTTERRAAASASVRTELRALTQAAHQRVDAAFSQFSLTDADGYRIFLEAHHAVLPACEQALAASGAADLLADWTSRIRTPALLADMAAIDARPAPAPPPLDRLSPAAAFGMMYVLEGSRLGGAVLARRVLVNPDPRCRQATTYLLHGEGLKLWPRFVAALDASPHVLADLPGVIASALDTFARFERAATTIRVMT